MTHSEPTAKEKELRLRALNAEKEMKSRPTEAHVLRQAAAKLEDDHPSAAAKLYEMANRAELTAPRPADTVTEAIAHAVAELDRLNGELERAQMLAADATEYRVHLPENGGTTLLLKRQSGMGGMGWAVSVPGYGGGRAWTMEGWQESISALSVDRLFCWPSAVIARDEARRALAKKEA